MESYGRFLLRFGVKNAVWFGDYCRFLEVRLAVDFLARRRIESLLDVGCAGTLFPCYAAHLFPRARVIGIDSGRNLGFAPREIEQIAGDLEAARRVSVFPADARWLPFRQSSFDAVSAISVVEHIRGDGDSAAVREMARVVRPNGMIVLSVPMARRLTESESTPWCPYFIRQYDKSSLEERLIGPARPAHVSVRYFGEGRLAYSHYYLRLRRAQERLCRRGWTWKPLRYLGWAALLLTPLASRLFLRHWDWQSPEAADRAPGGAVVALVK